MKLALVFFINAFLVLLVCSCGKESAVSNTPTTATGTTGTTTNNNASITITADKSRITADGIDLAKFTVTDNSNTDVTALATIYVNDKAITKNTFTTTTAGTYQVKAVKGALTSVIINVMAVTSGGTGTGGNGSGGGSGPVISGVYTQKTLAEFFTGTWCGICPALLIPLENYSEANPNTIMIGMHGPAGSPDPYQYPYDAELRASFNIFDQPNILLNRASLWDGYESSLDVLAKNTAVLGIGIETSVAGATISATVKVKYGLNISTQLKLVVYLVEDGLVYDQVNFGYYNLPNPIPGFVHHNVMRGAATDIFGDDIPVAQQTTGNVWQKAFVIDASKYKLANCKVVAFVLYGNNTSGLTGTLNAQIVNAGQSISY